MNFRNLSILILLTTILSACGFFPGVYKIDITQGNIITQDMVDQLRPGLSKRQVNFILGTPQVRDTFNQDRWDYLYSIQPGGGQRAQEVLSVFFENGELVSFEGDFEQSPDKQQFGQQSQQGQQGQQEENNEASSDLSMTDQ